MDELLVACFNGATYKVYADFAPQGAAEPYAIYSDVGNKRDNHASGRGDLKEVRYEIDVYNATKAEAVAVGEDIETRLLACIDFDVFVYQSSGSVEDETKAYRYMLDLNLWK